MLCSVLYALILCALLKQIVCDGHPNLPPFINDIIDDVEDYSPRPIPELDLTPLELRTSYDFVIVGSGPAGCVLANRLSENPFINVLLLEAGPRPSTVHSIPALSTYARLPETRWTNLMSPIPGACLGLKSQACDYNLGKVLGGSSAVNFMMYVRGNRHDFDRWESMGNYGWGFDEILPFFKKMENTTGLRNGSVDPEYRGLSGELPLSNAGYRSRTSELVIKAAQERGMPFLDYNAENQIGVDYVQSTTKNGRRMSAANAYLDPIKHRKNLHVMINSLVSKVIIDPETKVTLGVEYIFQGLKFQVMATKEVILSAGPINSPQLLWLSGIGPKEDLMKFGIPVLADLPVGKKMLDHAFVMRISARTNDDSIDLKKITNADVREFLKWGTGKLTVPFTAENVAFINNGMSDIPPDNPNVEFVFTTGKNLVPAGFTNVRDSIQNSTFLPEDESYGGLLTVTVIDLYPKSQGRLRIRGSSIHHRPIIEYPFFDNPRDLETLVWGIKEAVALLKSEALREIGAKVNEMPIPDCAKFAFGTDEYWRCFVRHMANTIYHTAATNKMGPREDPEAVVDPELRVYGIAKLRVADSSIAPTLVACHTQAISYVVGEKMSDLLKKEWRIHDAK